MAELPPSTLRFSGGCPDPGERVVELPAPPVDVGDDFNWSARDYDALRDAMLQDLAARLPSRGRWTAADLEVVLVEAFAAVGAQLSDMLDRTAAEAYLETARRPGSVRRLLALIGYDALALGPDGLTAPELERRWLRHPEEMEAARAAGPRLIRRQRRMVTAADYAVRIAEHPAVARATSWEQWSGAWPVVRIAMLAADEPGDLDAPGFEPSAGRAAIDAAHRELGVPAPAWGRATTLRGVLTLYLDAYRVAGQEVWLEHAIRVPIFMSIALRLDDRYFRSEVQRAVAAVLGTGPDGYFRSGARRFGEDLWESDIVEVLAALEGVEEVCLNRFKRLGAQYPQDPAGHIAFGPREVAACDGDSAHPERGYYVLRLSGGRGG